MYLCAASNVLQITGRQKIQKKRFCFPYYCGREGQRDHHCSRENHALTRVILSVLQQRMCFDGTVRRACAAASFSGKLFLVCLLLDTCYLASVNESAVLPPRDSENVSDSHNITSSSLAAPPVGNVPPSSSPSSSPPIPSTSTMMSQISNPPAVAMLASLSSFASGLSSSSSSSKLSSSQRQTATKSPSSRSLPSPKSPSRSRSSSNLSNSNSPLIPTLSSRDNGDSETLSKLTNGSSGVKENYLLASLYPEAKGKLEETMNSERNRSFANDSWSLHQNIVDSNSTNSTDIKPPSSSGVSSHHAAGQKVPKEFPMALVVASSTAAVSILLFFCLSYVWHTRQLDRRAQKLAIRLAAEVDGELNNCSQCRSDRPERVNNSAYMHGSCNDSEPLTAPSLSAGSESGGEDSPGLPPAPPDMLDELDSLKEEDEDDQVFADGSRTKPGGVGRTLGSRRGSRGRSRRSGSRSSRKWSGHSGGHPTRSSLVTDQEILNHFASRRHSTFFI